MFLPARVPLWGAGAGGMVGIGIKECCKACVLCVAGLHVLEKYDSFITKIIRFEACNN